MPKVIYKKINSSKQYIIYSIIPVLLLAAISAVCVLPSSSAYADGLDYNVQIRPSLNVTLSASTVSLVLNPSTASTSFGKANLDVTVGTNNPTGYKLYINTIDNENRLTNNTTLTTPVYIDTLTSSTTEDTFLANSWGYRISALSSGNEGGDSSITDLDGNNFFPYASGAMISSSSKAINNSTSTLTFGAKVDYDKPAGLYSLDFNFKAVPSISTYNIQNLPESECTTTPTVVTDARDGQSYTVALLGDGNCWMTQNLRFTGTTLTPADSDVKTNRTLTYGDLDTGGDAASASSYTDPKIHKGVDNNNNATVWYNYVAVSAGSITGSSNNAEAQESVCPAGWRLPTYDEISGITSYADTFSPVKGGYYGNGSILSTDWGLWWSSTANSTAGRYVLGYHYTSLRTTDANRVSGRYIRCVRKKSIQDYTKDTCQAQAASSNVTLTDKRDGNNYTVRYINGNCWMTQNLRLGANTSNPDNYQITLDPSTSNVETATTLTVYDLVAHGTNDSDGLCAGDNEGSGDIYATPCIRTSNDGSSVWYSYSAATAGTITGADNTAEATQDICPAGWRLPTHVENQTIGDDSSTYVSVFTPILGGYYGNGMLHMASGRGFWWSSTTSNENTGRYILVYNSDNLLRTGIAFRSAGTYMRCVAK